jgi:hypothetical protein
VIRLPRLRPFTWLLAVAFGLMAVSMGLLSELAIHVVIEGGSLPAPLSRYQPLAWPVLAALLVALFVGSVIAAVREYLSSHSSAEGPQPPEQLGYRSSASGQLPDEIREFTGRRPNLQRLRDLVREHVVTEESGPVIAISGHIGTGKSVLAIHFAYEVLAQYPDARLYVDLEGSSATPLDPSEALGHLMRGLTGANRGEPGVAGLTDEYRRNLRRKRAIIVLDNAKDEAQVRPLVPNSPGSLVLITSRKPLLALEGSKQLPLDDMSEEDAFDVLVALAGEHLRLSENQEATRRVAALCGHLPLALSITGARLRDRSVSAVESGLADRRSRLRELQDDERDVRASLELSYEQLTEVQKTLFRRLKLLPEARFNAIVAAALLDRPLEEARKTLEDLVDEQVLERAGDNRYNFNELVGLLADDKLEKEEPLRDRNAACERALRVYLAEAMRRAALLEPAIAELTGGVASEPAALRDQLDALDWFEQERATLIAAERQAAEIEAHDVVWKLAAALLPFLDLRGHRGDWAGLQDAALAAAHATDRLEDHVWASLVAGHLDSLQKRHKRARWHFEEALEHADAGAWRRLQALALYLMGRVDQDCGEIDRALDRYERAAAIFDEERMLRAQTSVKLAVATALHARGAVADDEVLRLCDVTLAALARQPADLWVLRTTGCVKEYQSAALLRRGDLERAGACCIAAAQAFRHIGFQHGHGRVLRELGRIRVEQGNPGRARELLEESVAIFKAIGDDAEANEASRRQGDIPPG